MSSKKTEPYVGNTSLSQNLLVPYATTERLTAGGHLELGEANGEHDGISREIIAFQREENEGR